jgi:hypothetical protein
VQPFYHVNSGGYLFFSSFAIRMPKVRYWPLSSSLALIPPQLGTSIFHQKEARNTNRGIVLNRFLLVREDSTDSDLSENEENKMELGNGGKRKLGEEK